MADMISDEIRSYAAEKGYDDDTIKNVVKQALRTAYKRQYGTDENLEFIEEDDQVYVVSNKVIVDEVDDPVFEISLKDAKELNPESEIGDELAIQEDPTKFNFAAIQAGKQRILQALNDVKKDTVYSEYITKVGEIIIGYYHREHNGNIYVDLGKVEGVLPARLQSPKDNFGRNTSAGQENRIKALVKEVKKHRQSNLVQLILSRSDSDFVRRILELEVPEIYNGIIEIHNIVRDPGYRTKVAVSSNRMDVDPVGACVGPKGSRIQVVITELNGEKIDVIQYSDDPATYIKNALSPAEVEEVIIVDAEKKSALAIVSDTQLSLAIGKQGLNVRLANRLVDWNIDVKTEEQFREMDIYNDARKAAEGLFSDDEEFEQISKVTEMPGITEDIVNILHANDIYEIETLLDMEEKQIRALDGLDDEKADSLLVTIHDALEIIEDDYEEDEEFEPASDSGNGVEEESDTENVEESDEEIEEEYYECPECGHPITVDMTHCPNCNVGLSFEFEDEDDDDDDIEE